MFNVGAIVLEKQNVRKTGAGGTLCDKVKRPSRRGNSATSSAKRIKNLPRSGDFAKWNKSTNA